MSGSNVSDVKSVYGTRGVASAVNTPGARSASLTWIDNVGDLWLLGGAGVDDVSNSSPMDDLWKFNPASGLWTWMGGSNTETGRVRSPEYGVKGVAAQTNSPGIRSSALTWTDLSGNFWLFGGFGANTLSGAANDLWKYNPVTGLWTWFSGGPDVGVSGSQGYASPANVPSARRAPMGWRDLSGNLWLFGGLDANVGGAAGTLADLWRYNITSGEWTWVRGGAGGVAGNYQVLGVTSANSTPGGRLGGVTWTDRAGHMWLFGGFGLDSAGAFDRLNDVWRIDALP